MYLAPNRVAFVCVQPSQAETSEEKLLAADIVETLSEVGFLDELFFAPGKILDAVLWDEAHELPPTLQKRLEYERIEYEKIHDDIKKALIDVMATEFTIDEMNSLRELFASPEGRSAVTKLGWFQYIVYDHVGMIVSDAVMRAHIRFEEREGP